MAQKAFTQRRKPGNKTRRNENMEILCRVLAIQAEIEAMKELNEERILRGESPGYPAEVFFEKAKKIKDLVNNPMGVCREATARDQKTALDRQIKELSDWLQTQEALDLRFSVREAFYEQKKAMVAHSNALNELILSF